MASLVLHDHSGEDGVAGPTTISLVACLNDETVSIECRIDDKLTADRIIDAMHVAVIDLIAECEDSVDDEHRSYRRWVRTHGGQDQATADMGGRS